MQPLNRARLSAKPLRYEADGRYYLHELLRQYAEEHLRANLEDESRVSQAHSAYYLTFLAAQFRAMTGGGQREAQAAIAIELENIRFAWRQVGRWPDEQTLGQAAHTLALYYRFRGPCQEGLAIFERTVRRRRDEADPSPADPVLAALLVDLARLAIQAGHLAQARTALEEARARYDRLALPPPPGLATDPLLWLGVLAMHAGNYAEAARLGQEARQRGELHQHAQNLPYAWWLISRAALAAGQYQPALLAAQRACAGAQATENRWYLAYCLRQLGNVASALGDYPAARQHYQASYAVSEEFSDLGGMAVVLTHLTEVAARQEDYQEARRLYERSRALHREIGDDTGLARALHGLGVIALAVGDLESARAHFVEALRLATEIRFVTLTPRILTGIAELLLQAGQPDRATTILALVGQHPSSDRETGDRAQRLLDRAATALPREALTAAIRLGTTDALDGLVARLQIDLTLPLAVAIDSPSKSERPPAAPAQPLPEPLTERELDVLRLIAAGHTNRQIADELFLTVNTVKSYAGQVYGKLQVRSRTQAIVRARELRLIT